MLACWSHANCIASYAVHMLGCKMESCGPSSLLKVDCLPCKLLFIRLWWSP